MATHGRQRTVHGEGQRPFLLEMWLSRFTGNNQVHTPRMVFGLLSYYKYLLLSIQVVSKAG